MPAATASAISACSFTRSGASSSAISKARNVSISGLGCRLAEISSRAGEYDRDGARVPDHLAGRREQSGAGIHPERDDGVALLVGRKKKTPCRVEADEARAAALGGLPADRGQRSVAGIGGVYCDAVVAAVSSSLSTQTTASFG